MSTALPVDFSGCIELLFPSLILLKLICQTLFCLYQVGRGQRGNVKVDNRRVLSAILYVVE